jgi:hypothetical protein
LLTHATATSIPQNTKLCHAPPATTLILALALCLDLSLSTSAEEAVLGKADDEGLGKEVGKMTNAEGRMRVRDKPVDKRGICSL